MPLNVAEVRGPAVPPILPPPKPASKKTPLPTLPKANVLTGANPRGVAIVGTAPKATVNDTAARTLTTGANPRGTAITQRPSGGQTSKGVAKAILDTFAHQPPATRAAIVRGAQRTSTPEGQIILKSLGITRAVPALGQQQSAGVSRGLEQYIKAENVGSPTLGGVIGHGLDYVLSHGLPKGGGGGSGVLGAGTVVPFAAGTTGAKIAGNAAKDVVTLPAETFSTAGTLGSDVLSGHPGKAVSDLVSPYVSLIKHPVQSFTEHPLDTYLMATGAAHALSRPIAGAIRAGAPDSAAARALSTDRPQVQLSGKLTHARPRYSPYPLIKAGQVTAEKMAYERAPTGELVPASEGLKARQTALETSRMVGVNERVRSANRDAAVAARGKSVAPSLAAKAAHGVKTALKYNPDQAAIRGTGVLARIADGTVRRPETLASDLMKHAKQVASTRADLLDNPKLLAEHDKYVKTITEAAREASSLKPAEVAQLFKAAQAYAQDYKPVEAEASALGHFGQRSSDALVKRTLGHYAITHMDASHDPDLGLTDAAGKPLSTGEIQAHMNGPEGTAGGRELAFTSDKARRGSAFYISQERRPLPENASNTYFAYQHGLTDPSHNALLEQHVRMQGKVDAHKAVNRLVRNLAVMRKNGSAWPSYSAALHDAPPGYQPVALSEPFHPQASLDQALEGVHPNTLEQEAQTHGLDLSSRLNDQGQGRWALADQTALRRIEQHKAQISSNPTMRAFKMTNNQFRQVALGTSAKHVPGIISEGIIRDVSSGVGVSSWLTGRRLLNRAEQLNPEAGKNARIQLTGGTVAGSTKAMMTRQVSDHFAGTNLHGPLKAFEAFMKTPGPRQMGHAWKAWLRLAINGTKHYIEEQNQTAGVGKAALQEFGSEHGPFFKALRLQGDLLDGAARGVVDEAKLRQYRAQVENIYGRWTDLTPAGQSAMMFSPFGLWWTNSVKWLARSPIDRPVQTGVAAAATVGTEKERQARGLDMFSKGAVPPFMQGAIPLSGGKVLAQNYYSPFGVANDPLETMGSLMEPWMQSGLLGSLGDNWLGKGLTSPGNPKGYGGTNAGQRAAYILNSMLATFIPLYSKAEQIAQGGASAYDSATPFSPQTKTPSQGPVQGALKAFRPFREYGAKAPSAAGGSAKVVIPGHGNLSGIAIPGHGSTSGVVIP